MGISSEHYTYPARAKFYFSIFKVFIETTEGYRSVSNPVVIR